MMFNFPLCLFFSISCISMFAQQSKCTSKDVSLWMQSKLPWWTKICHELYTHSKGRNVQQQLLLDQRQARAFTSFSGTCCVTMGKSPVTSLYPSALRCNSARMVKDGALIRHWDDRFYFPLSPTIGTYSCMYTTGTVWRKAKLVQY